MTTGALHPCAPTPASRRKAALLATVLVLGPILLMPPLADVDPLDWREREPIQLVDVSRFHLPPKVERAVTVDPPRPTAAAEATQSDPHRLDIRESDPSAPSAEAPASPPAAPELPTIAPTVKPSSSATAPLQAPGEAGAARGEMEIAGRTGAGRGNGASGTGRGARGAGRGTGRGAAGPLLPASWAVEPTQRELDRHYPLAARRLKLRGGAILACQVLPTKRLKNCSVLREMPAGFGFGRSILKASANFLVNPPTKDGVVQDDAWVAVTVTMGRDADRR